MFMTRTLSSLSGRRSLVCGVVSAIVLFLVFAAQPAQAADRGIVSRVSPVYPEMAKRMHISGVVKLMVTVNEAGAVTDVKTLDGNRMLSPAAEQAVRKWRFEAGEGSATVEVALHFNE
jgi:TonB family protein